MRDQGGLADRQLTADRHIAKGTHRPHVPQDLRGVNLAAFEAVDYVIIDNNAKPLDNIRLIEPDYFAKGFEYTATGIGNVISELWLFHPRWWRRHFRANGFTVVHEEPMGLFCTGEVLLGPRQGLGARAHGCLLGSSCYLFKLVATIGDTRQA